MTEPTRQPSTLERIEAKLAELERHTGASAERDRQAFNDHLRGALRARRDRRTRSFSAHDLFPELKQKDN